MNRRRQGERYEALAATHLGSLGFRILERQFRTRLGEIDLIAAEGDVLCFIEVRSKTDDRFGTAAESVTRGKQRRLVLLATQYLQRRAHLRQRLCRFDVVTVDACGDQPRLALLRNAFTADRPA